MDIAEILIYIAIFLLGASFPIIILLLYIKGK